MFKLLWLKIKKQNIPGKKTKKKINKTSLAQGGHGQTSLKILVFVCVVFVFSMCFVLLFGSEPE